MLSKINYKSVIASFWIGVAIGLSFLVLYNNLSHFQNVVITLLVSGSIGLLIGTVTEVLTAALPATIANHKSYFIINSLIGGIITAIVLVVLAQYSMISIHSMDFRYGVMIAVAIICIANVMEYLYYKKTNRNLEAFKNQLYK